MFKVLRNGLLRYILHTCPKLWCNPLECSGTVLTHVHGSDATCVLRYILHTCPKLWCNPCSKCYGVDCFGTYFFTHVQSCGVNRFKVIRSGLLPYILHTCPKLWCNPCAKCYGLDCFRTYFKHVQICDGTRVQSATEWIGLVHTSHMSKAVLEPVFKVLGNGVLRYIFHKCPQLWWNPCSKCYAVDCFRTYFTHVQSCDVTRVQSATEWTASVHTSHMSKAVM